MTKLQINSICVIGYGLPTGNIEAQFGEQQIKVTLTKDEAAEVNAIALRMIQSRQQALANEIATAQPALLTPPSYVDAEFTELPTLDETNNIPF